MTKRYTALLAGAFLTLAACSGSSDGADAGGIAALDTVVSTDEAGDAEEVEQADGGSSPDAADGDAPSDEELDAAMAAYNQCASDLGFDDRIQTDGGNGVATEVVAEDSGASGAAFDDEAFERLQEECDPILDDVMGSFELSPEQEAAQRDANLAFARCMRDAGFDFPDPTSGGAGISFEIDTEVDTDGLDAAFSECDAVYEELFGEDGAEQ